MSLTAVKEGYESLVDATLRVLDREGVNGITLRAVGAEAGVSAPAMYWHFKDKDALVAVVVQRVAGSFVERARIAMASKPPGERVTALGDFFVSFVIDHPHRFQLLFRTPPRGSNRPLVTPPSPNSTFGVVVECIREEIADGALRGDDPVSVALTITALGQGLVLLLERKRFADRHQFEVFARASFRRLLDGLAR